MKTIITTVVHNSNVKTFREERGKVNRVYPPLSFLSTLDVIYFLNNCVILTEPFLDGTLKVIKVNCDRHCTSFESLDGNPVPEFTPEVMEDLAKLNVRILRTVSP